MLADTAGECNTGPLPNKKFWPVKNAILSLENGELENYKLKCLKQGKACCNYHT